jgi:hypothetical protein
VQERKKVKDFGGKGDRERKRRGFFEFTNARKGENITRIIIMDNS